MISRTTLAASLALGASLAACGAPSRQASVAAAPSASASAAPTACSDATTCEQDCQRGVLASCVRASALMSDHPLVASFERLLAVEDRACTLGHGRTCLTLASHVSSAPGIPRDEGRARALRERACTLGDGVGCFGLLGDPESIDHPGAASEQEKARLARAEATLRRNCEEHDGRGCLLLSTLLMGRGETDQGLELMLRSGRELERSCFGGVADDCLTASLQLGLRSRPQAAERTRELLEHGCDLGSSQACGRLAEDARSGRSDVDVRKLRRACDADSELACLRLAIMIGTHEVPLGEQREAMALLDRSRAIGTARCERADAGGCTFMARMLSGGSLKGDAGRAVIALVEASCERGESDACLSLGEALSSDGVPVEFLDPDRGARLKKRACERGHAPACPDPAVAMKLYPRLEVPVVDPRARLVWEPAAKEPEPLDAARRACVPPRRLPTRADLASLLDKDGAPRRFARVTLPARGLLLSSEQAEDGKPWALDVIDGRIVASDAATVIRRCVSTLPARPAKPPPRRTFVRLDVYGSSMTYKVFFASLRMADLITIPSDSVPGPLSLTDIDARMGAVDVEVDASGEFGPVTRFVSGVTQAGVTVDRVILEGAR